ncbi:MAG: hypothetical protein K0R54_2364 [Clostridiaceae bacterium]|nr:hypothetical protein [Clostridiaceae bacterium]
MLPSKNLDDLRYKDMVENAKKMISGLTNEWINTSSSDPGITFIELFAWLLEMQQYYLNNISIKNKYKYLKLLGEKVEFNRPSNVIITLKNVREEFKLPAKCKFAAGNIIFETEREMKLYPIKIKDFFTTEDNVVINAREKNWKDQYYIFGRSAKEGNIFNICFDAPFPINTDIDILVNIFNDYTVKRNPIDEENNFIHLAEIEWEYYTENGWEKIESIKDTTLEFIKSGKITFNLKKPMELSQDNSSYMIRAILKETSYDVPPIFKFIQINSIKLIQRNTLAETTEFQVSKDNPQIELFNYLSLCGKVEVYIKRKEGLFETVSNYNSFEKENKRVIELNKIFEIEKQPEKLTIIVASYDKNFYLKKDMGKTDGFPDFFIPLILEEIYYKDFEIWISKGFDSNIYEKWSKCEDLYIQSCEAKSYCLDLDNKKLSFGDGINGGIPEGNIIVTGFSQTKANEGNVRAREINKLLMKKCKGISVTNYDSSSGGKRAPTIEECFKNARNKLKRVTRAVTDEDYKYIVKATPGLMIKNAKVMISNEQNNIFYNSNPNTTYIVVESYKRSFDGIQKLSRPYIENIKNNLNKYRLITTEIEIVSPEYIYIDVEGEIVIDSYFKEAKKVIKEVLFNYFNNEKWDFGKGVIYSDLYGLIDMIPSVKQISSLSINFNGRGAKKNETLDINIPLNGIIVLRSCEISVSDD